MSIEPPEERPPLLIRFFFPLLPIAFYAAIVAVVTRLAVGEWRAPDAGIVALIAVYALLKVDLQRYFKEHKDG